MDEIIGNGKLSEFFLYTARDLNSMDPKTPEQIYKTHLQDARMCCGYGEGQGRKAWEK